MTRYVRKASRLDDQPPGPQLPSCDPDLTVPYDLNKAKHHLEKAGLEGTKLDMSTSDSACGGAVLAAQLFAEHWRKTGLQLHPTSPTAASPSSSHRTARRKVRSPVLRNHRTPIPVPAR